MTILSRIVTVYRQWDLVAEWLGDQRLRQDGVEWVFVNDAPGDLPSAAVREGLRNLGARLICPECNLGRCDARNLGVRAAAGVWVEHIDGDDQPLPLTCEVLGSHDGVDVLLFPVQEFKVGASPEPWLGDWHLGTRTYWDFMFEGFRPVDPRPAGTLWRRESYLRLGGYDGRFECSEDLQMLWRACELGLRAGHVPQPKQRYRLHAATGFHSQPDYRNSMEYFRWLVPRCDGKLRERVEYLLGRQIIAFGRQFLREGWSSRRAIACFLRTKFTGRSARFNID